MHRLSAVLIAAVSAIVLPQIASAADLPVKAPTYIPPPAPIFSWTGCYLGGNIGYGWQKNQVFDAVALLDGGSDTGTGVVGGGQLGCDYQSGPWVIGIQGMFDWAGVDGSHHYPGNLTGETLTFKTRSFATLTGRIGYAVVPQALLYFKGGAAWVRTDYSDADPTSSGQATATRTSWTIGGGAEYKFHPNWSAFIEYNYIDLGSHNTALTYTCVGTCSFPNPYTYKETQNLQTILVGLNYRFGGL